MAAGSHDKGTIQNPHIHKSRRKPAAGGQSRLAPSAGSRGRRLNVLGSRRRTPPPSGEVIETFVKVAAGNITISVSAAGAAGNLPQAASTSGRNSSVGNCVEAKAGGQGGMFYGDGRTSTKQLGSGQGSSSRDHQAAGRGGGAGGLGSDASSTNGGDGGPGYARHQRWCQLLRWRRQARSCNSAWSRWHRWYRRQRPWRCRCQCI